MKWGRKPDAKKATSSSSSSSDSSSVVSQVFTFSWVSKLKRFGSKVKSEVAKPEQRTRPSPIPAPDSKPEAAKPKGRLQPAPTPGPNSRSASGHLSFSPGVLDRMVAAGGGGEAPRRRSVGEDEGQLARARRCELFRSARHNSAGGELELAGPQTLGQLVSFSTRSRQWTPTPETPSESGRSDSEPAPASHRRRRRRRRRSERRRGESGVSEETGQLPAVRVAPPPLKPIQTARSGGDPDRTEENLRRRSFSGKVRHRARPKVRVYSPRPAAAAVAAAERRRAVGRESGMEESLAVVKRSRDPQRDFRESMVEMIGEKGIGRRPEELERLLACYLLLNSDEHHDLIVKVFRQVWFELNPARLDSHRSI